MGPETFYQELQPELASGESVLWSGQPSTRVLFGPQDLFLIPFSLMWGGFAIFWEASVLGFAGFLSGDFTKGKGSPWFLVLWGIPFVVIGQYMIWGRFFYAAWKKKRMIYAVTNKRVLVVSVPGPGAARKVITAYLQQLPAIEKSVRGNGIGTITFGLGIPMNFAGRRSSAGSWDGGLSSPVPKFVDVEDAESVYRIVSDAREKAMRKD